ncbi:MAG: hypothetical protein Hals2KO_25130 [Halioglobus sp.]
MNDSDRRKLTQAIEGRIDEIHLLSKPAGPLKLWKRKGRNKDESPVGDVPADSWAEKSLLALTKQLEWLKSEDGGCCTSCGNEIEAARLLALHTTRHCFECANKEETR